MNKKYLSINTDDFGLSGDINRGIREAFLGRRLTDGSIMANGPAFSDAVDIAGDIGLPVSAHINLIRGKMLSGIPVYDGALSLWKNVFYRASVRQIEREIRMQIEKILGAGLKIGQINSEKHTHFFPKLFRIFVDIAESYDIPYIRYINEFAGSFRMQGMKANLLFIFSRINRIYLKNKRIRTADNFIGINQTGRINEQTVLKLLSGLACGHTELMVHIGRKGPISADMGRYFLKDERERELEALLSISDSFFIDNNIELKSFGG